MKSLVEVLKKDESTRELECEGQTGQGLLKVPEISKAPDTAGILGAICGFWVPGTASIEDGDQLSPGKAGSTRWLCCPRAALVLKGAEGCLKNSRVVFSFGIRTTVSSPGKKRGGDATYFHTTTSLDLLAAIHMPKVVLMWGKEWKGRDFSDVTANIYAYCFWATRM